MDSRKPAGIGSTHHPYQRRYREQRDTDAVEQNRHAVHRETFSGSATNFDGGENIRKTMTDDLKIRLLVVDDEQSIRKLCMTNGGTLGFACNEAESAETAATRVETEPPDLVLTDLKLPNQSGVDLLKQIKTNLPRTEVAIMTGHGSIESAVDAM